MQESNNIKPCTCMLASLPRPNPLCQYFLIRVLARCLTLTSRSGEEPRLQTANVCAWSAAHTSGKALWGWISLVQNQAHVSLYKLVMPEREVVVCSADEGQQARSCPELRIFYLLESHGFFYMWYSLKQLHTAKTKTGSVNHVASCGLAHQLKFMH